MEQIRAAGYTRVSTEEQAREGYGLDAQRTSIEAYCRLNGWTLAEVFTDAGVSGKSTRGRTALHRMLAGAEAHAFDRLVFWKLDRLSRSLRDVLELSDRLEKAGVEIVSIQEGIDAGTPTGRLYRNILGTLAEFERETITERIKEALAEKARQGELLGPLPIGYARNSDGDIVVDSKTGQFVRDAFERYATGQHSLREMATWAREQGIRSTKGNRIDRMNIRKMLRNPTYAGSVSYKPRSRTGTVIEGAHPSMISKDLFDKVQDVLTKRRLDRNTNTRHFGRTPYPLSGIAHCASCGAGFSGSASGRLNQRYMRCSTTARHGRQACRQPMVPAELIEAQLGFYVSTMQLEPAIIEATVAELRSQWEGPKIDRKKITAEIERWRRLFVLGEIDEARYRREKAGLTRELEAAQSTPTIDVDRAATYLRDIGTLFLESSTELRRKFAHTVFERLVVDGKQLAEIKPRPEFQVAFLADRKARFDGNLTCVVWLPGQDSNLQPIG